MPVEIIRSSRRTMAIEIKPDGRVIVRAPRWMPNRVIQRFVEERSDWIEKHLKAVRKRATEAQNDPQPALTPEKLKQLAKQARTVILQRVDFYAPVVGVDYGRITIRHQATRWGSCSSKGNLNFNCLLMLCPAQVLDYVVVHELCHRLELNHSKRFWAEVARVMPDYAKWRKWLKVNGGQLIGRMVTE